MLNVYIVGDFHNDTAIYEIYDYIYNKENNENSDETNFKRKNVKYFQEQRTIHKINYPGGAWLLHRLLHFYCKRHSKSERALLHGYPDMNAEDCNKYPIASSIYTLSPHKKHATDLISKPEDLVYRIKDNLGWIYSNNMNNCCDYVLDAPDTNKSFEELIKCNTIPPDSTEEYDNPETDKNSNFLIIDDRNNGFRDSKLAKKMHDFIKDHSPVILWIRSSPFETKDSNFHYILTNKEISNKTICVYRGECLRKSGVNFIQDGSVENFVESVTRNRSHDLVKQMYLTRASIIYFRESVLAVYKDNKSKVEYHFCPHSVDHMWQPNAPSGDMRGYTTILSASIAMSIINSYELEANTNKSNSNTMDSVISNISSNTTSEYMKSISINGLCKNPVTRGMQLGQVIGTHYYREGYCGVTEFMDYIKSPTTSCPLDNCINKIYSSPHTNNHTTPNRIGSPIAGLFEKYFNNTIEDKHENRLCSMQFDSGVNKTLSRVDMFLSNAIHNHPSTTINNAERSAEDILIDVVVHGIHDLRESIHFPKQAESDLRWATPSIMLPYARFGNISTCDRYEIESYMGIFSLIKNYLDNGNSLKPFSVAVFGPPGSGKSFAIKQIVRSINRRIADNALEYNISQFSEVDDLMSVFHHIHDHSTNGVVPLVIIDEFDSIFQGNKMGWLKYFLAPMQDGTFKDRGDLFNVGRAIFIFAGGTSYTFNDFVSGDDKDNDFKMSKGPDFVSRLRGHLNIKSINCLDEIEVPNNMKMRRATLLRSLIQIHRPDVVKNETGVVRVDKSIISAFLNIMKFRHGVRSMEALLEMSTPVDGWLRKSSLPNDDQLSMHVNAAKFMTIVNQDSGTI